MKHKLDLDLEIEIYRNVIDSELERFKKYVGATLRYYSALIKKKKKFSSYIRKFRGSDAKSYMTNDLLIYGENICAMCMSSSIRKPYLIYDFAPDPI